MDSHNFREKLHARRILVADDDECIRQIVSTALTDDGFDVDAAADGEQAWEALHHEHYDLLVTDNEMPRLKGIKLIERIRREGMSLPVIMASGSSSLKQAHNDSQLQITAMLPKPFKRLELLDTVRHALQSAGEAAVAERGTFHLPNPSLQTFRQHN
jgi:DNA-binding NtrC family response regulator